MEEFKCICGVVKDSRIALEGHKRGCKEYKDSEKSNPKEELVTIYLPRQITINDTKYFGNVTVPIGLARNLQAINDAAEANNVREQTYTDHSAKSPTVEVGKGGAKGRLRQNV